MGCDIHPYLCQRDYHCQKHKRGVPWLEAQCYSCMIEKQQRKIERLRVVAATARALSGSAKPLHGALNHSLQMVPERLLAAMTTALVALESDETPQSLMIGHDAHATDAEAATCFICNPRPGDTPDECPICGSAAAPPMPSRSLPSGYKACSLCKTTWGVSSVTLGDAHGNDDPVQYPPRAADETATAITDGPACAHPVGNYRCPTCGIEVRSGLEK